MLPAGLDILGRPKGENRIAHWLQPWEDGPERNRPERAAEGRSLFPKITFVESDLHTTAHIYVVVNAIRTPFHGDFLVRVVPRAEALGCFLFARRAFGTRTRKCPNSRARRAKIA